MDLTKVLIPLVLLSIVAIAGCTSSQPPAGDGSGGGQHNQTHPGECGGIAGIACQQGYECQYPEPYQPDGYGTCVQSAPAAGGGAGEQNDTSSGIPEQPALQAIEVHADDFSFTPGEVNVTAGEDLAINFFVASQRVYYGGLEMRGGGQNSGQVMPGSNRTLVWRAVNSSFSISSYWPASNTLKTTMNVIVQGGVRELSSEEWEISY